MIPSPVHLNFNIFAAVYVEPAGPFAGLHDVHRLCIIPLDNFYAPATNVMPLYITFKPVRAEAPWLGKEVLVKAANSGIHTHYASDLIRLWADKLPKQKNKKIVPVAYDWNFMNPFLKDLIGAETYDDVFYEQPRDIMAATAYINDSCDMNSEQIMFPRYGIESICNRLNITIDKPHDALNLCRATAATYRALLRRMFKGAIV